MTTKKAAVKKIKPPTTEERVDKLEKDLASLKALLTGHGIHLVDDVAPDQEDDDEDEE